MNNPIVEFRNINQWLDNFVDKPITPKNFVRKLSRYLNYKHNIRVELQFEDEVLFNNDFSIGGLYDPDYDEEQRKSLILYFYINHPLDSLWTITQDAARALSLDLIETLAHEYQHLHQHRSRGYIGCKAYRSRVNDSELRAEQEYLGSYDEIDAYAMNIAVRKLLGYPDGYDMEKYMRAFGDHHVTRRLRKKIYRNFIALNSHYTSIET